MSRVESVVVTAADAGQRLDRWFRRRFPALTHGRLEKLLRTGQIRLDGGRAKASSRIAEGQAIRIPPLDLAAPPPAADKPRISDADRAMLERAVLHKDDDILAINKPPGLPVQGGSGQTRHLDGMLDALRFEADDRPKLVHRLDKDTSGVLLLARSRRAANFLAGAFRSKAARKLYWAFVSGVPEMAQGKIALALAKLPGEQGDQVMADEAEGKKAVTYYRTMEHFGKRAAWLAMMPETGRMHQLRVHAAEMGTPIVGDSKYGGDRGLVTGAVSRKLHLHARAIEVPHPRGGLLRVVAPLPEHMRATWKLFELDPEDPRDPFEGFDDV